MQQKQLKPMCFQQQIQQPCQKRLTMAPTTLLTIADNASAAFPASLLSAFTSLFNQLLKAPLSFGGEPPPPPPLPPPPHSLLQRHLQ